VRLIATVNSAFIGRTADFFVVRDRLNAIGKHQCSPLQPWCGLVSSSPTFSAVAYRLLAPLNASSASTFHGKTRGTVRRGWRSAQFIISPCGRGSLDRRSIDCAT
jgi:hypothetical protein